MTLLIGANLQTYVIMFADTRASWQDPIKGYCFNDGDHKIVSCGLGLITGSGFVSALSAVKAELMASQIKHTDQVIDIIKRKALPEIQGITACYPKLSEQTCFMISYRTVTDGQLTLCLALMHPNWDYQLGLYDDAIVVMPSDSTNEEAKRYRVLVREKLVHLELREPTHEEFAKGFLANINENISIIGQLFYEIAQKSSHVSPDLDFAVMLLEGSLLYGYGLSEEVRNGEFKYFLVANGEQSTILNPGMTDFSSDKF